MWKVLKSPTFGFIISWAISFVVGFLLKPTLGTIQASLSLVLIFGIIWFTYLLLLPFHRGKDRIRRISTAVVVLIATVCGTFMTVLARTKFGEELVEEIQKNVTVEDVPRFTSLGIALIFISFGALVLLVALNFALRDNSVMGKSASSFEQLYPEEDFRQKIKAFTSFHRAQLELLDKDTTWDDAHFSPIDAKVEVRSGKLGDRKIEDLVSALRKYKNRKTFLVLGDPGSGKSVALRRLCRELLLEVPRTNKIPIYVNLKEWQTSTAWSVDHPPTYDDFYDFVFDSLKGKEKHMSKFVEDYLKKFFERGDVFWILDSFDEIPSVLNEESNSTWLIDRLSQIISTFLGDTTKSRGIIASRFLRAPSNSFEADVELEIRPLSEYQSSRLLGKSLPFQKDLIDTIFKDRPDLASICSNPFSASLLCHFVDHEGKLPANKTQLYDKYLNTTIASADAMLKRKKITVQDVLDGATEIAYTMFDRPECGLEIELERLQSHLPHLPIHQIVEVLTSKRIARIGQGESEKFSFVHRRFQEYFMIKRIVHDPSSISLSTIAQDSKYRDALVLFCEVADNQYANLIAGYCWSEIEQITGLSNKVNDLQYLRSIQCLRFLSEAFTNRKECISPFKSQLTRLSSVSINENDDSMDFLLAKTLIDALELLDHRDQNEIILKVFDINDDWLTASVIKACRRLPRLDSRIEYEIHQHYHKKSPLEVVARRKEILFSLSLSDAFFKVRRNFKLVLIDKTLLSLGSIILWLWSPLILFIVLLTDLLADPNLEVKGDIFRLRLYFINNHRRWLILIFSFVFGGLFSLEGENFNDQVLFPLPIVLATYVKFISIIILLFPVIPVYLEIKLSKRRCVTEEPGLSKPKPVDEVTKVNPKDVLKFAFIFFSVVLLSYAFVIFLPKIAAITIAIATLTIMIVEGFNWIRRAIQFKRDRKVIQQFFQKNLDGSASRVEIYNILTSMETSRGQELFLDRLQAEIKICNGTWPEGIIPKLFIHNARSILASLEERWQGLGR